MLKKQLAKGVAITSTKIIEKIYQDPVTAEFEKQYPSSSTSKREGLECSKALRQHQSPFAH